MNQTTDVPLISFKALFLEDSRRFLLTSKQLDFLANIIDVKEDAYVLDVGCGTGFFTREYAARFSNIERMLGADIDQDLLEVAKQFAETDPRYKKCRFVRCNAKSLPWKDSSLDNIMCSFFLSRVPTADAFKIIHEMIRVTKRNGYISLFEPCMGAMSSYYEDNPELSSKMTSIRGVKSQIQQQLADINENIGLALPRILSENGLKVIDTEIMSLKWWTPFPFPSLNNDLQQWLERRMKSIEFPNMKEVIDNYGELRDAAAALRIVEIRDFLYEDPIVRMYAQMGVTLQDLVQLNQLRVEQLKARLVSSQENSTKESVELIPVILTHCQKIT